MIISPKFLKIKNFFIFEHNVEGQFAGEIEYAGTCKLYNKRIVLLIKGVIGYNVYNIFMDQIYNIENNNI